MHRPPLGVAREEGLRRLSILSANRPNRSKLPTCSALRGSGRPGGVATGLSHPHSPAADNCTIALPISFSATPQFWRALASSFP
jgi:hypothetical protein